MMAERNYQASRKTVVKIKPGFVRKFNMPKTVWGWLDG